jgi:hypothetical protein
MADDDIEESESAETQNPAPIEKPDAPPSLPSRLRPWMEMAYWTLAIGHYGSLDVHQAWAWVLEQLFPLVQPYM